MSNINNMFTGNIDGNSVTVDMGEEPPSNNFAEKLRASIDHWERHSIQSIEFKVPVPNSSTVLIISTLFENGFHIRSSVNGFLMMLREFPRNQLPNIPVDEALGQEDESSSDVISIGGNYEEDLDRLANTPQRPDSHNSESQSQTSSRSNSIPRNKLSLERCTSTDASR